MRSRFLARLRCSKLRAAICTICPFCFLALSTFTCYYCWLLCWWWWTTFRATLAVVVPMVMMMLANSFRCRFFMLASLFAPLETNNLLSFLAFKMIDLTPMSMVNFWAPKMLCDCRKSGFFFTSFSLLHSSRSATGAAILTVSIVCCLNVVFSRARLSSSFNRDKFEFVCLSFLLFSDV